MMKYKYVIVLLLLSCQVFGQYLNNTGHFISDATKRVECKVNLTVNGSEIEYKDLKLKGNSLYETPSGIITLSGDDESVSSKIRLYTLDGEEIFNKTFKDIINFSLSSNKHFAAFHNGQQIELFDIANRTFKSINGSNVFSVNDQGQLAWFDEDNSTINFDNQSMKISEPVYKILFFNNRPLFISKSSILVIEDNISRTIYSAQEGRFFDAAVFKDKLYISIKKELAKEFLFTSLSSSDLKNFNNEEETHFPLASAAQKIKQHSQLNTREDLPKGELIRTPLNYYSDSVYQPVGNSYDEMQDYGDPYLHPGVDLLGNYLQEVYSVKKGYVKSILTTGGYPYWRIAISNRDISEDSQGYLYAHLEETSFPYAVGDSVNEGDVIGQLVNFPVQGFVHCHFARITDKGITWKGDWWTFDNPLSYMSTLIDKIPPTFEKAKGNDEFAYRDKDGIYLSPNDLHGKVKVISKVYDQVNSPWHIGVNKLSYNLSSLASPQTILLDSFAYEFNFYNDYYEGGSYYLDLLNTLYSRDVYCFSVGNYDNRDFYHIISNSDGNDTIDVNDSKQYFNTGNFPDGSYIFRVFASDASGNSTMDSMIITINNTITAYNNVSKDSLISIFPNPFTSEVSLSLQNPVNKQIVLSVKNIIGEEVYSYSDINSNTRFKKSIDLNKLPNGVYFLDILIDGKHLVRKMVKD